MNQKDLTHRKNLHRMVREKEKNQVSQRLEMHRLLEHDSWLGEKENYIPYHDYIWWLGHDQTSRAIVKIWNEALDSEKTEPRHFGSKELTDVYQRTLELVNNSKLNIFQRIMKGIFK